MSPEQGSRQSEIALVTAFSTNLLQAIERGTSFIKACLVAGQYAMSVRGADQTTRFSDQKGHVFVGHFIADALQGTLSEIERTILLVRILSEERQGTWGFSPASLYVSPEHESFLVDADDTAYVLRTLRLLGAFRDPQGLVEFHRNPPGAFVTFQAKGGLVNSSRFEIEPKFVNNLSLHPEVNANVFLMLRQTNLERYINYDVIEPWQFDDGSWPAYFYPSRFFACPLVVELISPLDYYRPHLARTLDFLRSTKHASGAWGDPGNAYDTALALRTLAFANQFDDSYRSGVEYLLTQIQSDGSWRTDEVIWQYADQGNDLWRAYDEQGTLCTSLVVTALRAFAVASRCCRQA